MSVVLQFIRDIRNPSFVLSEARKQTALKYVMKPVGKFVDLYHKKIDKNIDYLADYAAGRTIDGCQRFCQTRKINLFPDDVVREISDLLLDEAVVLAIHRLKNDREIENPKDERDQAISILSQLTTVKNVSMNGAYSKCATMMRVGWRVLSLGLNVLKIPVFALVKKCRRKPPPAHISENVMTKATISSLEKLPEDVKGLLRMAGLIGLGLTDPSSQTPIFTAKNVFMKTVVEPWLIRQALAVSRKGVGLCLKAVIEKFIVGPIAIESAGRGLKLTKRLAFFGHSLIKNKTTLSYFFAGRKVVHAIINVVPDTCRRTKQIKTIERYVPTQVIKTLKAQMSLPTNSKDDRLIKLALFVMIDGCMEFLHRQNPAWYARAEVSLEDPKNILTPLQNLLLGLVQSEKS